MRRNLNHWPFDDHIRLNLPAVGPIHRRPHVLWIALQRTGVGPFGDRFDFTWLQGVVVQEATDLRICEPRWHLARSDGGLHRLGPRTRFFVRQERHRRYLARTMAGLAILLQNRKNVLVKGHWRR